MKVKVLKNILAANDQMANRNRQTLDRQGVLALNIMASPGAGKTSLILETIARLKGSVRIAVIEGDIASTIDADKISESGAPVVQINTGGGCHLDANMIASALENLVLDDIDLLFIENVGNLVCPASFKLGEHKRVVVTSTPEGDDKPRKYPMMFAEAEAIVINKTDLLSLLDFNPEVFKGVVTGLNPSSPIFELSSKTGQGFEPWLTWLKAELKLKSRT